MLFRSVSQSRYAREGKSGFLITRGEINRKEERAGPRMYPDEVREAGNKIEVDAFRGEGHTGTNGAISVKPVALKKPWAATTASAHLVAGRGGSVLPNLATDFAIGTSLLWKEINSCGSSDNCCDFWNRIDVGFISIRCG